ncbi:lactosylceramide 1,3-N-acetyl-beta-D-glucosaminyltransferase [Protopterus annectens]|uniref:lactosylceramide 1,3-N-acetyl-beta-D-glucosaminyltransferase n=1 Tax=Protopterus annectens TaxID=7888 RepID=UPI001CFA5A81|nr:lactosylceramide 1,3-N-acetyl-beta-D-glucosaminyltransferase [Protopterus annectens]XP_043926590.1 lactosylceramide 1,3-N-acetyl-beta-D-glucosaminyltransferase [Protopterus annectens]XP_043926591.1 lactosylceramide 1,3-N-acetyl-beta-D-glucosaminyltransferase [Protopterus annectens]XP_043926592.1 lactosylceramide 1,3-N-acetyl-beta-D-glucosaminyltransferase [Protopterus annectens]XP_043926593.1 lactosylceramide 1,3-N-acetyl-beta-D-glucosaminyltransferase [Protopterus annectens]XP_043926594.1 
MFIGLRRGRKCQLIHLFCICFIMSLLLIYWEQLDTHVVSHMKSYSYRYMINQYNFLNDSLSVSNQEAATLVEYPYLINQEKKCKSQDVLLVLFVKTPPENQQRRDTIRRTWGNEKYIRSELKVNVKIVFVLGVHKDPLKRQGMQKRLLKENDIYSDLVQQNFLDTFHNLTQKFILQMKWANTFCQHANFVMSADDDVFIHMPNLVAYLQDQLHTGVQNFWIGRVHRGAPPIRDKHSKYYVSHKLYQWISYPDYTAGAAYVMSNDVAAKVYTAAKTLKISLYIDDVFMGICANKMGISPQYYPYFSGEGKAPYHPCIYNKMITSHGHLKDMFYLWKETTDPKMASLSSGFWGRLYCRVINIILLCKPYYVDTYPCRAAFL